MPITQIPFQDPVAPPEKPQAGTAWAVRRQGWETAYRALDDDARVPHLLIQLQDDLDALAAPRSCMDFRSSSTCSSHCIFNIEKLEKYLPWHSAVVAKNLTNGKDLTFLELPPDLQKVPQKPNTNIVSDKNRIAMTRHPELDVKELRKILATPPPGAPGSSGAPQPPPQSSAGLAQNQPAPQPQQAPNPQIAQLQTPATPNINNEFKSTVVPCRRVRRFRTRLGRPRPGAGTGGQGNNGDFGLGTGAHGRQVGNLEILSDTQGVDFGPYLQRVLHDVRQNWYNAIPESAEMKHGSLIIEFAITKDGNVAGMKLVSPFRRYSAGSRGLGGHQASDPFPALPAEFGGHISLCASASSTTPPKKRCEGLD